MEFVLCLLALVALTAADMPPPPGYGNQGYYGGPGFYGRHHGHGHYRAPSYHGPGYAYSPEENEQLDALDKLYSRLDTVQDEIKTGSQMLANLESRMSLSKRAVDKLNDLTNPALLIADQNLNNLLNALENDCDTVSNKLNDLSDNLEVLANLTAQTLDTQDEVADKIRDETRKDIEQEGAVNELNSNVEDFKPKLLTVIENQYSLVDDKINLHNKMIELLKAYEHTRVCEAGQVTLDADDRKAEYLFQTEFQNVPQILYSICGYNFDLEKRPDDYDHYYSEPNAMGVLVTAEASKTGLTVELFDQSFGDTGIVSADVCFQVCAIGTGRQLANIG